MPSSSPWARVREDQHGKSVRPPDLSQGRRNPPASSAHPSPAPQGLLSPVLLLLQGEDGAGCRPHLPAVQELHGQPERMAGAPAPQSGAAQRRAQPDRLQAAGTEGEELGLQVVWTARLSYPELNPQDRPSSLAAFLTGRAACARVARPLVAGVLMTSNLRPQRPKCYTLSTVAQTRKGMPTMRENWVQSLGREDLLEKEMATQSSILAWKIPWTEEPSRLQSMGSQRVRQDTTSLSLCPWKQPALLCLARDGQWALCSWRYKLLLHPLPHTSY